MDVFKSGFTAEQMEYALSAVPSIGENGNWWIGDTDTGVFAGGVDVTGAEVGQTIKVAAVDENGRPTAWEAAKSGENWELIKTLNFTEDTYSIDMIETDNNGNPFELTAYQVVSVSGAPSASQTFRINPFNNGRNVSSANALCEPTWGTGDRGLFAQVRIEASRMLWYIMGNGANLNLRWAALASGNITQISWSNFGSNYIKAGSVVEIWGIRA